MKTLSKVVWVLAFMAIFISFVATSYAATHNFWKDETLDWFIKETGNTFEQLALMNPNLTRDYKPEFWDEIHYLGQVDIDLAILWCEERAQDQNLDRGNRKYFRETAKRLRHKKIRWETNVPTGIYYELILDYSRAWQEKYWQAEELLKSKEYERTYTKNDGYYTVGVSVRRDYQGVTLWVSSDYVDYECAISKNKYGGVKQTRSECLGGLYMFGVTTDYFWPYRDWTKTLPKSAQQAFLGMYGIGAEEKNE